MSSFVGFGFHSGEQKSMIGRISNIQRVGMVRTCLLETEKEGERVEMIEFKRSLI